MFNPNDVLGMKKQSKSYVKYAYNPGKQLTLHKHKSNNKTFKEKNLRERDIHFSHSSAKVSDNLMDKLMGPNK